MGARPSIWEATIEALRNTRLGRSNVALPGERHHNGKDTYQKRQRKHGGVPQFNITMERLTRKAVSPSKWRHPRKIIPYSARTKTVGKEPAAGYRKVREKSVPIQTGNSTSLE